jgi:long-chain acyl-CoA synthetase
VAVGYFKREQETQEEFYEENGRRWFRTGDIGTFDSDGVLRIIDRKKDLVKLQHGEYVSYGRTESLLKTAPIIDQICAYADPTRDFIVAIVIPDKHKLAEIAPEVSLQFPECTMQECCSDPDVRDEVVRQLREYGAKNGLKTFEVPAKVLLVLDEWTPDNGLVTAAFKIRRKFIYDEYRKELEATYSG